MTISTPEQYHAALYIRLSREDEQDGPSQSVQNQASLLRDFAVGQALPIYDTYIDDGFSGTDFDRPAFNRMIADIEAGRVNMVITKDLSRLGRDYILTGHYMERYFPEHRVRYLSLLDGIDTGVDSSANDITPFRAIMNDMYAKDISKKIKSVKRDKQRKGLFIGGKPSYGYRMHPTEKNKIVVDEEAAGVVRRIFSLALTGISCGQIARQLNDEHIPPPSVYAHLPVARRGSCKGLWSSERIAEMLRNETYIGNMVQGRSVKISYKSRKCRKQERENWIVVEGTHAPIVDQATFQKVGALLDSRRHTRRRTYDFLLKGLIFCRECGRPLSVVNRKNARGEDVLYFVCRTYQRPTGAGTCTCHAIKEQTVLAAMTAKLQEVCAYAFRPEDLLPVAKEMAEKNSLVSAQACGKDQAERLTAKLDRIYIDRLNGLLSEEDFRRIYTRMSEERERLRKEQERITDRQARQPSAESQAEALTQEFLASVWTSRVMLMSLIRRVELTEEKEIVIYFRFRQDAGQ